MIFLLPPGPSVWEKSTTPPAFVMNCALPPVLLSKKAVPLPLLVVMVALAAVAKAWKNVTPPPLVVMLALAALGASVKVGVPKMVAPSALLMIVAVPAFASWTNAVPPNE